MENIDTNDGSSLFLPDVNDDSVDIYDGLDINFSSNAEKSSLKASQLKESMDLYEEIVAEEQQSRDSSYSELKSRFQAAQNQIKELRRRVEQMEKQNTGLNTENCRLKKNICALLQTARQEVTRKDAEIQRLNQRSDKGHHHHQFHINNLQDQKSSSSRSTIKLPPPPSGLLPPPPSTSPAPAPPPPPLPASPPREDRLPSSLPQPSTNSRKESNQPSGSSRKFSSSSSTRHSESGKHKSKHREEVKNASQKLSESADRRHRSGSDLNKDRPDKHRSHKADKHAGRRYDSGSCKSRNRSDRSKSPPPESAVSSDDKKVRSQERRQDAAKMSTSNTEHSAAHSSKEGCSRDHRKIKASDVHVKGSDSKDRKKSSSNQHAERCTEFSKERGGDTLSKDSQRKEDRRLEDKINSRKHKRSTLSEMSTERERERSKESDQDKVDVRHKKRQEKTHEALKRSSQEPNVTEKSSVEENSANRKLCFMETLNLTLSPIKKPVLVVSVSQNDLSPVDKVVENKPDDESSQPNIEDMCVIDEVDSSELEAGSEEVAVQSSDSPTAPSSEKTHKRCDVAKHFNEKDKNQSETPAADKQLEDNSVQTTSSHSQHPDTTEDQMTVHLTPTSPQISSLKATDISRNYEDKLASDRQADCVPLEAADGDIDTSESIYNQHTGNSSPKVNPENNTDQSVAITDPVVLDPIVELKCRTAVQKRPPVDSVKEDAVASLSQENPVAEDVPDSKQISPTVLPQLCPQGLCASASISIHKKQDGPKDADAVSSTISLESLPQEGLSLPEAIFVLTQPNEDSTDSSSIVTEPSSSTACIAVSKVSSTTEETALPEMYSDLTFTPKKNFTPGKNHVNSIEPSSSVLLLHDEDSMMHTLSNLRRIPDAISPLRSPIRITKRTHLHVHGKPGHVKSLQKDFSTTAVDANAKKLDVNKENKYPGSPANHDTPNMVDTVSDLPSSLSDTELEEGEILSESDEMAAGSPVPATKRVKLAQPVKIKPSPKSLLKRKSEGRCVASKETAGVSTHSPKSRFKTVCPAATKASFSTIEEVMETFKMVRAEIRKKYMKLHKTFPKKSFYGVMDNFQESFLEFVDGAHFGQICSQAGELKSRLKKLIVSVFSKVSNNGIVKRIFEQQAVDLKQRLWDFVDVQVDYLFKDIYTTLNSLCKPARTQAENKRPSGNEKVSRQPPAKTPQCQQVEAQSAPTSMNRIRPCTVAPYKTGLGSRGKDIRITHVEKDKNVDPHPTNCSNTQTVAVFLPPKNIPSTPEKSNMSSLVVSQNVSLLDKTDFELLTEQQASSLTFNLVRDTQMGEIFKCLLQGSDLLETSGITGDNTAWSLGTPRKDGERLISITTPTKFDSPSKLLSPTKFDTPSKLIATWSSISPRKMTSPQSKDQIRLNPALFDESCLLEVPPENRAVLQSSFATQRSYSILAEDLAVSLTIPSPLKSDSHLSFLQPSSMHLMSTPDSVISAHISEDALLDGEDVSEQDIHLALDTDNSSCGSSSSEVLATPFVFKPDLPMQALVMEKSNDHFIVKIRQAATCADTTLTDDDSLSRTLTEEDQQHREDVVETKDSQEKTVLWDKLQNSDVVPSENSLSEICQAATGADIHLAQDENITLTKDLSTQQNSTVAADTHHRGEDVTAQQERISCSETVMSHISPRHPVESYETDQRSQVLACVSDSERDEVVVSETSVTIAEDISSPPEKGRRDCDKVRKRKKHQEKSKAKRFRKEEEEATEEMVLNCRKDDSESRSSPASLSPSSLHAKNVIRKKGEVVMAWTRDEDRAILIDLKTKGASRETFSALSEKLNKPSEQIAHRFYQLMKLFKKQEKMDS